MQRITVVRAADTEGRCALAFSARRRESTVRAENLTICFLQYEEGDGGTLRMP